MDFIVFGAMLGGAALPLLLAAFLAPDWFYRGGVAIAVGASFVMVWISLAVGIIGEPGNVGNLMFAGVLAIALGGSILARFRAGGMANAMFAAAFALCAIPIAAVTMRLGLNSTHWPLDVIVLSGFFAAAFAASALLFRYSARTPAHIRWA